MKEKSKNIRTLLMLGWPVLIIAGLFLFKTFSKQNSAGRKLYLLHCASCHMEEGEGLRQLIPPLKNADYLSQSPLMAACLIRQGINGKIIVNGIEYNRPMPGNSMLSPSEITAIIRYIQQKWYPLEQEVSFSEVDSLLKICSPNP
ncbi:MAG: cytochrome c [Bacteroidia bacterium]|nr:cytochrome c [Bacteroidia bacterium]